MDSTSIAPTDAALNEQAVYLRPDTKIEPLVGRWHAWPALIAPATHAMNVTFRHIPNLKSFVSNASVHVAASKDPALLGGRFVALPAEAVSDAKRLIEDTSRRYANLLIFATALRDLDRGLQERANGYSLDTFSRDLPPSLAGLVELVYDLNHHPKIRLIEEMLYAGGLENTAMQEICLHSIPDTERPFFMNTPLLDAPDRVFLPFKFDDARIDTLAMLRSQPCPLKQATRALGVPDVAVPAFRRMLTSHVPERVRPNYEGAEVRVRYFGHASVLVETASTSILIDPTLAWSRDGEYATLTFDDLPDFIDVVVLTHGHQDHCTPELLLQLRHRIGRIVVPRNDRGSLVDPSLGLILKRLGFTNVISVDPLESVPLDEGEILSLPFMGEHCGLDVSAKHCVCVKLAGRCFVFLADSDGIDPVVYQRLRERVGKVNALFIGMECRGAPLTWLYGPLLTRPISKRDDESRRLSGSDCERAWAIMSALDCDTAFVYAMGQEPWLRFLMGLAYQEDSIQITESDKFIERCRQAGKSAERLLGCREMTF